MDVGILVELSTSSKHVKMGYFVANSMSIKFIYVEKSRVMYCTT